jgi:hypothetical protein
MISGIIGLITILSLFRLTHWTFGANQAERLQAEPWIDANNKSIVNLVVVQQGSLIVIRDSLAFTKWRTRIKILAQTIGMKVSIPGHEHAVSWLAPTEFRLY